MIGRPCSQQVMGYTSRLNQPRNVIIYDQSWRMDKIMASDVSLHKYNVRINGWASQDRPAVIRWHTYDSFDSDVIIYIFVVIYKLM